MQQLPEGHKWAVGWFILKFFSSSLSWKGGLHDLRVSDAELQWCGRKVCVCMRCSVCIPLQMPSVRRTAWRLTDCKVGVVILPDSISLTVSLCLPLTAVTSYITLFSTCRNSVVIQFAKKKKKTFCSAVGDFWMTNFFCSALIFSQRMVGTVCSLTLAGTLRECVINVNRWSEKKTRVHLDLCWPQQELQADPWPPLSIMISLNFVNVLCTVMF